MARPVGPVDILFTVFPEPNFTGELAEELKYLVESGQITVLDLIFIYKDADGNVTSVELADMEPEEVDPYTAAVNELEDILVEEDILNFAEEMPNGSAASLLVFENTWAAHFVQAMKNVGGEVLLYGRIPADDVAAALAE
jgi:hypothetical protein